MTCAISVASVTHGLQFRTDYAFFQFVILNHHSVCSCVHCDCIATCPLLVPDITQGISGQTRLEQSKQGTVCLQGQSAVLQSRFIPK